MKITDIKRGSDLFFDIAIAMRDACHVAIANEGIPIPWWFEDTSKSIAIDALEELIERGIEIEDRK